MGWSLYESGTTSSTKHQQNNEPVEARYPASNKERCDGPAKGLAANGTQRRGPGEGLGMERDVEVVRVVRTFLAEIGRGQAGKDAWGHVREDRRAVHGVGDARSGAGHARPSPGGRDGCKYGEARLRPLAVLGRESEERGNVVKRRYGTAQGHRRETCRRTAGAAGLCSLHARNCPRSV